MTTFIGLLSTPWLILVSTSAPLYFNNQADLHYRIQVLWPFVAATIAIALLVFPVRLMGERGGPLLKSSLWFYYLAGFAFLPMLSLQGLLSSTLPAIAACFIFLSAAWLSTVLARRQSLENFRSLFMFAALAFVIADALPLVNESSTQQRDVQTDSASDIDAPNVYHLLFDEYQGDIFDLTIDEERRNALAGFDQYADTTTPFGRTSMALPAIFSGLAFDYASSQIEYKKEGFNGQKSVLRQLKDAGYRTEGYLFPIMPFKFTQFDNQTFHARTETYDPAKISTLFNTLWLFSTFPLIAQAVLAPEQLAALENRMVMDPDSPLTSLRVFRQFLSDEADKTGHGRYTFVHLILPHFPNVLDENCQYSETADVLSQSSCATSLIIEFTERLRALGRLDGSLVIIHSDHGSSYQISEDDHSLTGVEQLGWYSLEWSRTRSKAMLLIKPPYAGNHPLAADSSAASLLDIAPTLRSILGLKQIESDGVDLQNESPDRTRVRYYHFYDQKGGSGWTDELTRFRIVNGEIAFDQKIPLPNNPKDF